MRFHIILNPSARMYQRDPTLLDRMRQASGSAEVHVTHSLEELDEVCDQLAKNGCDAIALSGGDGTLSAGVSALSRAFAGELPPVAPVPGGTAGTIARNWGIAGDPISYLRRLLAQPPRRNVRPSLHLSAVGPEMNNGAATERLGFIFGTGLVSKFFELYYEHGAKGYAGSAWLVAQIFVHSFYGGPLARRILEPMPCTLVVDGVEQEPDAWSLICSAVIRNLGIHMMLTHCGGEDHARPHLVATPMTPRQLGPRAPLVLAGKPLGGPHNVDQLTRNFEVRFPELSPYVLDGELLEADAVTVKAGPQITILSAQR